MRLLGAVRLSHLTDETTSPERQREQITYTAKARGDELVTIVEDLDVSGSVNPFTRDRLGPWLTDPDKITKWDGLIVAKLDRLTRSLFDFQSLLIWCKEHDKTLISVSEGVDFSTPTGRLMANILIMFAEFERERMSERRAEAAASMRLTARWGGGVVPFGYEAYQEDAAWFLRPYEPYAKETRNMAKQAIAGVPARQIAEDLNTRSVPTSSDAQRILAGNPPLGKKWLTSTVVQYLRTDALCGYVHNHKRGEEPQRVYGSDGLPVRREALLDEDTWQAVQDALARRSVRWNRDSVRSGMLTGVAFCQHCNAPLHKGRTLRHDGKTYNHYYQCANMRSTCKPSRSIRMDDLEKAVNDSILDAYGWAEIVETRTTSSNDHMKELTEVGKQIADLTAERFVRQIVRANYDEVMAVLQARYDTLWAMPTQTPTTVKVRTGVTIERHWPTLSPLERGKWLRDRGIKAYAYRTDGEPIVAIDGGEYFDELESLAGDTHMPLDGSATR
jgi:site-specific DNA recombinase